MPSPSQKQTQTNRQNVNVKVVINDTKPKRKKSTHKQQNEEPTLADIPVNNTIVNNIRPPNINQTGFPITPQIYRPSTIQIQPENPLPQPSYFESAYTNQQAQMENLRQNFDMMRDELRDYMMANATNAQHIRDIEQVAQAVSQVGDDELQQLSRQSSSVPNLPPPNTIPSVHDSDFGPYPDDITQDMQENMKDTKTAIDLVKLHEQGKINLIDHLGYTSYNPQNPSSSKQAESALYNNEGSAIVPMFKMSPLQEEPIINQQQEPQPQPEPQPEPQPQPEPSPVKQAIKNIDTINRVKELFERYTKSSYPKARMQLEAQIKGIANENGYKPNTMTSLTKIKNELIRRLNAS